MLYLYLDESGDLGFDFFAKKPSRFFTVTVLVVKGIENNRKLIKAVKKTLKRKLPKQQTELKGAKDSLKVKEYFYKNVVTIPFEVYSLSLNKSGCMKVLQREKTEFIIS